ncbi:MAG TPA: MFS transporter [Acidimicrobiales bacterium]|nr:MFS transporter [Acidimicrobiales bacterium]
MSALDVAPRHGADEGGEIRTRIPARLDRLPWSKWHWMVVIGLGTVWILDGLEVTIVGAVGSTITRAGSHIAITTAQVGDAAGFYVGGACLGALLFGHLTDKLGRKRLFLVTLALYLIATLLTATSVNAWMFFAFRFFTGMGIGGEYAAINSAIDELIPARVRGTVDLVINGSYWVGTAAGAAATLILLDPNFLATDIGWRTCFGLGAVLGIAILIVRRQLPESPRWLLTHGKQDEAEKTVSDIEAQVTASTGVRLDEPDEEMTLKPREDVGVLEVGKTLFLRYPRRSVLGVSLFVGQAFLYNAVFFTYALVLTTFFKVSNDSVGYYLISFAVGNFLGPLLLGRLFDTVGRRAMIASTYMLSGAMLGVTAWLFAAGDLTALTQTIAWVVIFFFASAGASAAYLTVSEIFPMETRALAIAFFYAVGTGIGGIIGPVLFGALIASNKASEVAIGYVVGGVLMFAAGLVEIILGVDAEQKSLEDIASPLSAVGADGGGTGAPSRAPATRGTVSPTAWAPRPQRSLYPRDNPYRPAEVDKVLAALRDAGGALSFNELAAVSGGRYWGPGRLRAALRATIADGRVRALGRDRYGLTEAGR